MVHTTSLPVSTVLVAISLLVNMAYSGKIDIKQCGSSIKFSRTALKYFTDNDITLTCRRSKTAAAAITARVPAEVKLSPRSRAEADAASALHEKLSRMQLGESFAELNLARSGDVRENMALPATERVAFGCGASLPGTQVTTATERVSHLLFFSPPSSKSCIYLAAGLPGQKCLSRCTVVGTGSLQVRMCGFKCGLFTVVLVGPRGLGCKIMKSQIFPFSAKDVCRV